MSLNVIAVSELNGKRAGLGGPSRFLVLAAEVGARATFSRLRPMKFADSLPPDVRGKYAVTDASPHRAK
jgi:hypothetical protein